MSPLTLLADANDEIDQWFDENPVFLGLFFVVIGLAIGGWGVYELRKGFAHDKWGRQVHGGLGKFLTIMRLVVGGGCILFGLYRMIFG